MTFLGAAEYKTIKTEAEKLYREKPTQQERGARSGLEFQEVTRRLFAASLKRAGFDPKQMNATMIYSAADAFAAGYVGAMAREIIEERDRREAPADAAPVQGA